VPAVGPAGACRIDAYRGATHGSADVPEGERPVDGGVDGELGAAQRPDGGDSPPSRPSDGLDGRVESLGPDGPGDRAPIEEVTGLEVKGGMERDGLPDERPG